METKGVLRYPDPVPCTPTSPGVRVAYTQARRYLPLTGALVRFGDRQQSEAAVRRDSQGGTLSSQ